MTDSELMRAKRAGRAGVKSARGDRNDSRVPYGGWLAKASLPSPKLRSFERGFVTYSNDAKAQMIGVREETLAQHGAVRTCSGRNG